MAQAGSKNKPKQFGKNIGHANTAVVASFIARAHTLKENRHSSVSELVTVWYRTVCDEAVEDGGKVYAHLTAVRKANTDQYHAKTAIEYEQQKHMDNRRYCSTVEAITTTTSACPRYRQLPDERGIVASEELAVGLAHQL
jgi:hypothetical protein